MSRSGYNDDCDNNWDLIRWRGQVASAIRGRRGQAFLCELAQALDALPEKKLIKNELKRIGIETGPFGGGYVVDDGNPQVCALGAAGLRRGVDLDKLDPEDYDALADAFGVAHQLVREIEFENDEAGFHDDPEQRWRRMRGWVARNLRPAAVD